MNIAFAREIDCADLALLHYGARDRLPKSFMISLGPAFLRAYYSSILKAPGSLILCARTNSGKIEGFISGTLSAVDEINYLRTEKLRLFVSALPFLILKPIRMIGMYRRMVGKDNKGRFFIEAKGPRIGFWCWREGGASGGNALVLFRKWLQVAECLGYPDVYGEVDADNHKLLALHRVLGAEVSMKFQTPEGRDRLLVLYKSKAK